jgi:hypothetical protein
MHAPLAGLSGWKVRRLPHEPASRKGERVFLFSESNQGKP